MDCLNSARLHTSGRQYLEAAKILNANVADVEGSPPLLFLIAQSVELFMKAHLRGSGFSKEQLKKLRHNLAKIYEAALSEGLGEHLSHHPDDRAIVALLNAPYCSKDLQYIETGMKIRPAIAPSIDFAKRLDESLREFCAEKRKLHSQAASIADKSLADLIALGRPIIISFESDASLLQELRNGLKKKQFAGPALLIVDDGEKLHLATHCGPAAIAAGLKAGDLLRDLAALAGGKGGGKPDQARGATPDRSKLEAIKAAAARALAGECCAARRGN